MVRRHVDPQAPLGGLRHIMALVTQAQVSGSAHEAKTLGLLAAQDQVVMHRGHLIHAARQSALDLVPGFTPATVLGNVYAAGEPAFVTLQAEIAAQAESGKLRPHDQVIATALARVVCGGGGTSGWRNEQEFLDLERQAFVELMQTEATQARIRHLLTTGKPLRN